MKFLLPLLLACSISLADSDVKSGDHPRIRIPADVTTDKTRIHGSWTDARSNCCVTLDASGAASLKGESMTAWGTWAMEPGGLIRLELKDAAAKPCFISCYVVGDELIDDQVCYRNVYFRQKERTTGSSAGDGG